MALPAVDLPVSRTGVALHYSPLYRVTAEPGTFRTETFQMPGSSVLSGATTWEDGTVRSAPAAPGDATQALVDSYRAKSDARRPPGLLPPHILFPAAGPSLFLVSELTAENQTPAIELSYQKEKKGDAR